MYRNLCRVNAVIGLRAGATAFRRYHPSGDEVHWLVKSLLKALSNRKFANEGGTVQMHAMKVLQTVVAAGGQSRTTIISS